MKTISVGELRQNPTAMLAEVEAGETYAVTKHGHVIARVVPPTEEPRKPKRNGMRARDRIGKYPEVGPSGMTAMELHEWDRAERV